MTNRSRVSKGTPTGGQFKAERKRAARVDREWESKSGAKDGGPSPWGAIQWLEHMAPGIDNVSTAGHGGIKLSRERNAAMPIELRRPGGWYEEDCEAAMPMWIYADDLGFDQERKEIVKCVVIRWFPDEYEAFTGEIIPPGESYIKDERTFYREHADDLVSHWATANDDGETVSVGACRGGRKGYLKDATTYVFEMPKEEYYQAQGEFGMVIDEKKYTPATVIGFTERKDQSSSSSS